MLLSVRGIAKELGKNIIIYPFSLDNLKVMGYNLMVSEFGYSLKTRKKLKLELIQLDNGTTQNVLVIEPRDTVYILTNEVVWVSKCIAGTFHSKVDKVSMGLSHISTTLDPGWIGNLLITITNNLDSEQHLHVGKSFVTLLFHRLDEPTYYKHGNPSFRTDMLDQNKIDYSNLKKGWLKDDFRKKYDALDNIVKREGIYLKLWKRIRKGSQFKLPRLSPAVWAVIIGSSAPVTVLAVYLIICLLGYANQTIALVFLAAFAASATRMLAVAAQHLLGRGGDGKD